MSIERYLCIKSICIANVQHTYARKNLYACISTYNMYLYCIQSESESDSESESETEYIQYVYILYTYTFARSYIHTSHAYIHTDTALCGEPYIHTYIHTYTYEPARNDR